MPKISAQEAADKWKRRMQGSSEDMRRGASRVSEAPGVSAAKQAEKMMSKLIESVTSGEWARAVSSITLSDWQQAYTAKGIPRVTAGTEAAGPKVAAALGEVFEHIDRGMQEIARMPSATLEDSIARQAAWTRHMARFKKRS